jgi:molybdopterin-guanine dinucleotide biosynthesis protein A
MPAPAAALALATALAPFIEKAVVPAIVNAIGEGDANVKRTRRNSDAASQHAAAKRAARKALEAAFAENPEEVAALLKKAGIRIVKEENLEDAT